MTALVELDAVTRRFVSRAETVLAVDGVSLAVEPGELIGVAGPSGSGKTTLLNLLLGWERPDAGTVSVDGSVWERVGWSAIAMVPQELGLLPELTGGQNVELPVRLGRSVERTPAGGQRAMAALGVAALADRLPADMSMGEQQRFAVARAVGAEPRLLVADEPTSHQDEANADRVMELLRSIASSGGAVIVATHDDRLLDRADRVLHLRDGRLVGAGDHDH